MNLSVSLLDPVLYTAATTCARSPFLFTVSKYRPLPMTALYLTLPLQVCAIASRFYTERVGLYSDIMHYAQLAAGTALISGPKNVEAVQAYIAELKLFAACRKRCMETRPCTWQERCHGARKSRGS